MADEERGGTRYYDDEPDPRWEVQPERPEDAEPSSRRPWIIVAVLVGLGAVVVLAVTAQTLVS